MTRSLSILLLAAALIASLWYWPAAIIALLAAAWTVPPLAAIMIGVLFDILYGPPPLMMPLHLHEVQFPFTILSILFFGIAALLKKRTLVGERRRSI